MKMQKRFVQSVNRERKTDYHGVVMFELNLDIRQKGKRENVDVMLLEEDYNTIKEKGYYLY